MPSFARRLTALAIVAGASCNVYSPSLLTGSGGSGSGATGGSGGTSGSGSGAGGDGGAGPVAGKGGSGGGAGAGSGGAAGNGGGAGGTAGTSNGGRSQGGAGGNGGSGGSGDTGGDSGMGGEAGMDTGVGGTSGAGGSGGMAGTAGGGMGGSAGGGMAGTAGGGTAGMGGSGVTGCAKLTVPIDGNADVARFVISLTSNTDFSAATISMNVYVESGAAGSVFLYVQDGSGNFRFLSQATGARPQLKTLVGKWTLLTWNVGTEPVGGSQISKAIIKRIGIEVAATPDTSGWSPSTVVYVDSVSVNTPALSFQFPTSYSVSTATDLIADQGMNSLWLNSGNTDTTAMPLTAPSWVDTCP